MEWKPIDKKLGIAKTNFEQDKPHRISLNVGDTVVILRESTNWYYGYNKKNHAIKGIFPKTYIQIVESEVKEGEHCIKRSEIVDEITTILREWHRLIKKFYLENNPKFEAIQCKMMELIKQRSLLISGALPVDEMRNSILKAALEIDTGNKLLGLDMIVRDENGNTLNVESLSTTQLYNQHVKAANRISSKQPFTQRKTKPTYENYHSLLISVINVVSKVTDDTEILFTLYDGEKNEPITENYVVKWSRNGISQDYEQYNNLRVVFTDLSGQDLDRNKIYLVAYIIRLGGMEEMQCEKRTSGVTFATNKRQSLSSNSSLDNNKDILRRPYGVAYIDLTKKIFNHGTDESRSDIQLSMPLMLCEKESLDNTLRKLITNKDFRTDAMIWITIELLYGNIKQVKEDYPHLISKNVIFARKLGFPELIFPGDFRNDLYVTLLSGEFGKGTKRSDKNIEVTAYICNDEKELMKETISKGGGSTMTDEYRSVIYYHEGKPKWRESFKVNIPIEDFKRCHIKFLFRHRCTNKAKDSQSKPFALSYVKLEQENGIILPDGTYNLIVYKLDKKYDNTTQHNYFGLPTFCGDLASNPKPSAPGFALATNEASKFTIQTNLCSTKLTQNVNLLGLLNWASNKDNLENSLIQLETVPSEEIVKFLEDILDVLFKILVENDSRDYNHLVFCDLLKIIDVVSDRKYLQFQSVLDVYINENFSSTLAYGILLSVLEQHLVNALENNGGMEDVTIGSREKSSDVQLFKTTRNLQYIMKFIFKSRILFMVLNGDRDRQVFETNLDNLLSKFVQLISHDKGLMKSQGYLLKHLPVISSDMMQVFEPMKISQFIVDILENIPSGRLNQSKMNCIKELLDSKLFYLHECRTILLPQFCQQVREKLENKEEGDIIYDEKNFSKLEKILGASKRVLQERETPGRMKMVECINIMNNMLEFVHRKDIGPTENDIRDIMLHLLRTIIQAIIPMDRDNNLRKDVVAIMLGIFHSMDEMHYTLYVNNFNTTFDLQEFLIEILMVFKTLVSSTVFDSDWKHMIMHQNLVILNSLKHFARIIMDKFFSPFEELVWANFFACSIAFLTQSSLAVETLSIGKNVSNDVRYQEIRLEAATHITEMWYKLGEHKGKFVQRLVTDVLEMSMIPDENLRRVTIPIFFDMMQCEFYSSRYMPETYGDTKRNMAHAKGNFVDFETEMIKALDTFVEGGKGDEEYKQLFSIIMLDYCERHTTIRDEGVRFVKNITDLMDRLLEYRTLINDESKENRMACTVNLLDFYSQIDRKEMYIRYVYKLYDLHSSLENFTEAAYTLKLHSDLLQWNDTKLSLLLRSSKYSSCQTHRQLKEFLYKDIIDNFNKGQMWENALDLCKELVKMYEDDIYDYHSLSEMYLQMAEFHKKILTDVRMDPVYFRIAFYGKGFENRLRNKEFIYRERPCTKLSDFSMYILSQHPRAELLQIATKPGPEITESDKRFIQIFSTSPIINAKFKSLQSKNINTNIIRYYEFNNINHFEFQRPFKVNDKLKDTVENIGLERTIYTTKFPLPGNLRWFPIIKSAFLTLSPIKNAIEAMEKKNKEIRRLVIDYKMDPRKDINSLIMPIKGVVDAAVNGGFVKYEEAFFSDDFLEENPDQKDSIKQLKDLIADQIPILEVAFDILRKRGTDQMRALYQHMDELFIRMKSNVETKYGKRTTDLRDDSDRDSVTLRRPTLISTQFNDADRLSGASTDSGLSKSTKSFISFNPSRTSGSSGKVKKEKTPNKRRDSRAKSTNGETLNNSTSQWYTYIPQTILAPIASTPTDKEDTSLSNISESNTPAPNTPLVELTEALTPKRPLRSEVEKEKRLSRPGSLAINGNTPNGIHTRTPNDNVSVSEDSSNRNSITTLSTGSTNSANSEEYRPPLPEKIRHSTNNDYGNLPMAEHRSHHAHSHHGHITSRPLPELPPDAAVNTVYDFVEIRNPHISLKREPPIPPPKPSRQSKAMSHRN